MRVYLDLCALKRLFDERQQERVHLEAEAIALILERLDRGAIEICTSEALEEENSRNPDPVRRARAAQLLAGFSPQIRVTTKVRAMADRLQGLGFGGFDARHIACAMHGRADALVTSDDRLIRLATLRAKDVGVRVVNPVDYVRG